MNVLVSRLGWVPRPRVGLILGTGLGGIASELTGVECVPYRTIPQFPHSTALSHAGEWLFGDWTASGADSTTPVAVMSGRFHLYEGYSFEEVTRPIRVMAALGVTTLIITNAAGGLASGLAVGDVVVIRDHINFTSRCPCDAPGRPEAKERPPVARRGGAIYDAAMQERLLEIAARAGIRARSGVYVGVTGPNYETRAEYRFFRQIGDVVGMSTVPEALAAVCCGMRVAALSTVTNVCDPDDLATTSGEEVAAAARGAERRIRTLLGEYLRSPE